MKSQAFLEEHFPLVVKWDTGEARVKWFHDVGIARVAGEYVVELWPYFDSLRFEKLSGGSTYTSTYASAWTGIYVRIVEHGVGEIQKLAFMFDDYLVSRTRVNDAFAEEHFRKPNEVRLAVIARVYESGLLKTAMEVPFWECERPTRIEEELLEPMQRYIKEWL